MTCSGAPPGQRSRSPACTDTRAQMAGRRIPRRHQFLGIPVLQLIQGKTAAAGNLQRIAPAVLPDRSLQARGAAAQMPLAIRIEDQTAPAQRLSGTNCSERILQRTPATHMHVHIAGLELPACRPQQQAESVAGCDDDRHRLHAVRQPARRVLQNAAAARWHQPVADLPQVSTARGRPRRGPPDQRAADGSCP